MEYPICCGFNDLSKKRITKYSMQIVQIPRFDTNAATLIGHLFVVALLSIDFMTSFYQTKQTDTTFIDP